MADWNYQNLQMSPSLIEAIMRPRANGLQAFSDAIGPGIHDASKSLGAAAGQNTKNNQIAQLLQQSRGGQPQMAQQGQPQAPMQQPTGQAQDPLGLFGAPPNQAGGGMGMNLG